MTLLESLLLATVALFVMLWLVSRKRNKDVTHQRNVLEMQRDGAEERYDALRTSNERLRVDNERLQKLLNPPSAKLPEEVPGLQRAMQDVVDAAKADEPQEIHRLHEGDRKFPHVGFADVVVEDGRPDARMAEQAEIDENARILQGTTANREPLDPAKLPPCVGGEVLTSPTRRAEIDARIRREAVEEAIKLLPAEKVAELKAEGGDAAVEAYVAPVADQLFERLAEDVKATTETFLASPGNIRQTWELGEPKRAPSSLEANLERNKVLARGLLGPEPGSAEPQADSMPDQPLTDEAKTPETALTSN